MDMLILKVGVTWVAIDVLFLATLWYFATTIKPFIPEWWKTHICDQDPDYTF